MTRKRYTVRASLALTAVTAASLGYMSPASAADNAADPTFVPTAASNATPDLVGVGSDTSQQALHYLAEGSRGVPGYNSTKTAGRIASFAADGAPASVVLRDSATAITRPNGSGAGKGLLYGNNNNPDVSFARSSSALSTAEISGNLQAFPFAVDGLRIAKSSSSSHAPASLTIGDLVKIYDGTYDRWNKIPGNAGGSTDEIKPLKPQAGSGTLSFFEAQLKAANGGESVKYGTNVGTTQEHSDADIKSNADAIAPFSTGRATSTPTVALVDGFSAKRALYNVTRQPDAAKASFTGIFGPAGFVCSPAAEPLIADAGFDQLASQDKGGVCGVPTQGATTNLLTASAAANAVSTTTSLTAVGSPSGAVRLSAEVEPSTAVGTVDYFEGSTKVGSAPLTDGESTLPLSKVEAGQRTYTARFVPTTAADFGPSTSTPATATVADAKYDDAITVSIPTKAWGATNGAAVTIKKDGLDATGAVDFVFGNAPSVTGQLTNGAANLPIPSTTTPGVYWGVVTYGGDANFDKQFKLVTFTVTKATTSTKLTISPTKVKVKKTTRATVTVTIAGTAAKASGTVTLKIGSATVGTGTVSNGKATVTLKAQTAAGRKSVRATFTPSGSAAATYGSSTSSAVTYTVTK